MRHVLVFDVNETLLDLKALDVHFERIFGDAGTRQLWFSQLIQSALVSIVTNHYVTFGAIGMAALDMLAERRNITLSDADRQSIRAGMVHLPAHSEVRSALERLQGAGFRLSALTNSTTEVAEAQLIYAGLRELFEFVFSADTTQRLKPAPEPYRMTAERLGVPIQGIRLVAAHSWDVAGALNAGCAAAFVARPGMVLDPLTIKPDLVAANLDNMADLIIQFEGMN